MGQAGASAVNSNAPNGIPSSGMVTMPNGLPNHHQYEGITTAPRHEGLGSVGSVGSVATNFDGLQVTNFNGVTTDALAATRIPGDSQKVVGYDTCSSVKTRMNGFSADGYAMPHQDCFGYDNNLGYDGLAVTAMNHSVHPSDSASNIGVHSDYSRRFSMESEGLCADDLHGVLGVELPVPSQGKNLNSFQGVIGEEVSVPPRGNRAQSTLGSQTVTSMMPGGVPPGYHVSAGELCTTQEPSSSYRANGHSLETTTVATNAYIPRSHGAQAPPAHVNSAPSQMSSNSYQGRDRQGVDTTHAFGIAPGPSNIAAPAAAFAPQGHSGQHSQMPPSQPPAKAAAPPQASEAQQRAAWAVGSVLEVFSATAQKWHVASVVQAARSDGPDVLTVQFLRNGEPQLKQIYRTDAYLAVLGAHTEGEIPPGFQMQPSQSRPGQYVYFDTATSKKYSSAELAWKLHFERVLKTFPSGNAPRTGHNTAAQRPPTAQMTPYGPAPTVACR